MATSKVTFTLDEKTVRHLEDAAEILKKPKSQIVREAVTQYREQIGKVSPAEIARRLRVLDRIAARPPRPQHEIDAELKEIRLARRHFYSRSADK